MVILSPDNHIYIFEGLLGVVLLPLDGDKLGDHVIDSALNFSPGALVLLHDITLFNTDTLANVTMSDTYLTDVTLSNTDMLADVTLSGTNIADVNLSDTDLAFVSPFQKQMP